MALSIAPNVHDAPASHSPDGVFALVPEAPTDTMFGLSAAYRADTFSKKVDLGVGAYRDGEGQPWILPSLLEAKELLHKDKSLNHEYLPIAGMPEFVEASRRVVFGDDSEVLRQKRVASVQTLSGTGALHLGSAFLNKFVAQSPSKKVYVSQPPYVNHVPILESARLETATYPYYSRATKRVDVDAMLERLASIPAGSIVLLHACAHNPTGTDPSQDEWERIASTMLKKRHVAFFDSAYQGFATGSVDDDAWPIRMFVERGFNAILVAQSYAKNFGLYGERVGCLHVVLSNQGLANNVYGQLLKLQRVTVSTPPAYGARIVSLILNEPQLYSQWLRDIRTMSGRIRSMRCALRERLERQGSVGAWEHITRQVGMFSYSGLDENEVRILRDVYHVYTTRDGRLNIAGLNEGNVDYVAHAILKVRSRSKL